MLRTPSMLQRISAPVESTGASAGDPQLPRRGNGRLPSRRCARFRRRPRFSVRACWAAASKSIVVSCPRNHGGADRSRGRGRHRWSATRRRAPATTHGAPHRRRAIDRVVPVRGHFLGCRQLSAPAGEVVAVGLDDLAQLRVSVEQRELDDSVGSHAPQPALLQEHALLLGVDELGDVDIGADLVVGLQTRDLGSMKWARRSRANATR